METTRVQAPPVFLPPREQVLAARDKELDGALVVGSGGCLVAGPAGASAALALRDDLSSSAAALSVEPSSSPRGLPRCPLILYRLGPASCRVGGAFVLLPPSRAEADAAVSHLPRLSRGAGLTVEQHRCAGPECCDCYHC